MSSSLLICLLLAVLLISLDALPFFGFGKESSNSEMPSNVFYGRQIQDAEPARGYVYSRMRG